MKLLRCFWCSGTAFCAQPALAQAEIAPMASRPIDGNGNEQDALTVKDAMSGPESPSVARRLPDVVVTARRVEENIQLTPLAITVVSNTDLTAAHVTNLSELQSSAPGLTISNGVGQPGSATLYQRGQGSSDALIAVDKAIGTYVNGVYSARSSGGAFDLVDIARIEVLRGPQGTLFGRNTTGGAINVVPNEPTFISRATGRVEVGNYGHVLTEVTANLPVLADQIAVRVAYRHDVHDGYGRNDLLNRDAGSDNRDFVRLSAKFTPNDVPLSVLLAADFNQITNDGQMTGLKSFTSTRANQSLIAACAGAFGPALSSLCPFGRSGDSYANYTYERGKRGFYDFSLTGC